MTSRIDWDEIRARLAASEQADAALRDTLLVMITATRAPATRLEEIGFAAMLNKPVEPSLLLDAMTALWLGETRDGILTRAKLELTRPQGRPAKQRREQGEGKRVLLVEDNAVNRRVASRLLEKLGCRIDLAVNGAEAVERVQRERYDLVIMDCQMPVMDGFEATRRIRELDGPAAYTRVIALTANAMAGDRDRCLAAGMDDYLSKPIDPEALRAVVETPRGTLTDVR